MRAITREQMRRLDRRATEVFGIPALLLMENAGRGAAASLRRAWPDARRVLVVAGRGANGGDGMVVARHLHNAGLEVQVLYAGTPEDPLEGEAGLNRQIVEKMELPLRFWDRDPIQAHADVLVDALLGIGPSSPLREDARARVAAINAHPAPVLALDLPSGLDADTGEPLGDAVRALRTVTFGAVKQGLLAPAAAPYVGELELVGISLPREEVPV